MNWKEIKKECPKAFELLEQWHDYVAVTRRIGRRRLYSFFDENEIYIDISIGKAYQTSQTKTSFYGTIKNRYGEHYYNDKIYFSFNSRTEAEEAAFEKAFSILEEKLQ